MPDIISEIIVPKENANDDYIKIIDWFFEQGDYVKNGEAILEIETSKAIVEIYSELDGYIEILHSQGAEIPTNGIIGRIHAKKFSESSDEKIDVAEVENLDKPENFVSDEGKKISNKAKLLIDKFNIDQSVFGDKDFVREIDVHNYLNKADKKDKTTFGNPRNSDKKYSLFNEIKVSGKERDKNILWVMINYIFRNWLLNLFVKIAPVRIIIGIHRLRGVKIGKGCFIDPSAIIETAYPFNISIGNDVRITARTVIMTHIKAPIHLRETGIMPPVYKPVVLEDHCFIGVNAVIMPGVTVGKGSVVASGAVVVNNVPPYTMVAGNPAKAIKQFEEYK